eukprot:CAMPEP_0181494122 /NCGR_PEP_ID=MMETSP1110-20121109/51581_1 /TAXON_ID=174948 /ORGANISM="Symbiodinium sp., Strain CCMP421" /LENGTH=96 /DNA_ID=CAMNT_0023621469 /DNA_START=290 /DNA_END=580 /DNA_ORIENTATION=-
MNCALAGISSTSLKSKSSWLQKSFSNRGLEYVSSSSLGAVGKRTLTLERLIFSLKTTLISICGSASDARALSSGLAASTSSTEAEEVQPFNTLVCD